MKLIISGMFLVAFVTVFGLTAQVYADANVSIPSGTSVPGCEETNECYIPYSVTVESGEHVTWKNNDSAAHTVTSVDSSGSPSGIFDSSLFMAGSSFSHKFTTTGTFNYLCMVHPWMQGIVKVVPTSDSGSTSRDVSIIIDSDNAVEGNSMNISVKVLDLATFNPIEHVNYDIKATQNDRTVLDDRGVHSHRGTSTHSTAPLPSDSTVYVTVVFKGIGLEQPYTGPIGKTFSARFSVDSKPISSPSLPVPSGVDVVIPSGTSVPGCEDTRSCYKPYRITVGKYSTVTWYNADSAAHTVTSGSPANGPDGEFDSSLFMSGASFSHRFTDDGTYNYHCMVHPWMTGQVVVTRSGTVTDDSPTYPAPSRDTTPPKILKPTDIVVDAQDQSGIRIDFDVLAIDETDEIVRPSCNPSSGSFFSVGTTSVTCNARDSAGNRAQPVSFSVTVNPPQTVIPNWVKNVAEFWCGDKIDDASFIEGIQYLIDNGIIVVSSNGSLSSGPQEIPQWVKNNACWWSEGLITDDDFASGIEFLVRAGIIRV